VCVRRLCKECRSRKNSLRIQKEATTQEGQRSHTHSRTHSQGVCGDEAKVETVRRRILPRLGRKHRSSGGVASAI
jgi:hypothetical protein